MDIFENLENLNVSEECFDDIIDIVEEYIGEKLSKDKVVKLRTDLEGKARKQGEKRYDELNNNYYREPGELEQLVDKHMKLYKKARDVQSKHAESISKEEAERAEKSREELKKNSEKLPTHRDPENLDYRVSAPHSTAKELRRPDYQHAKKAARKALHGHTMDGGMDGLVKNTGYPSKTLYRIGKKVLKHRSLKESIEQILEDLRSLQREKKEKIKDLQIQKRLKVNQLKRRKEQEEQRKREEQRKQEQDDDNDYYDHDDDRDYMDVISRKSPGVSFTSDEWHDNY